MEELDLLSIELWNPLGIFGIQNDLLKVNSMTLVYTWIVLLFLLIAALLLRIYLTKKKSLVYFLVTSGLQSFIDLTTQSFGTFYYNHFSFIVALFIFIATCNLIALIPWIEEPTKDLNTTLALGFIGFFYKDYYAIKVHGLIAFIKEFFSPFFLTFPLNVIGHLSKIISISFRLFGNIFGGSIIMHIYNSAIAGSIIFETLGMLSGFNLLATFFFVIFEGFIQAFVFTMLTLTYLAIAIEHEEMPGEAT
jgi:F-type H+-transporting ATPase subunit a